MDTGCSRRGEPALLAYVPADSVAVVSVNWSDIRSDSDLRSVVGGDELVRQMHRLGVEGESVKALALFTSLGSKPALVLRGKFERRDVTAHLKSNGWSETSADGVKLFVNGSDFASIPADGLIIAGDREGVVNALDAGKRSGKSIGSTASFKTIKDGMSSQAAPITVFLIAPEGTLEAADAALSATAGVVSFFGYGEIGAILRHINIAAGTGFSIATGSDKNSYAVNFCVLMRDEQAAAIAAGALEVMKGLSNFVGKPEDRENLKNFEVTQKKKLLTLQMQMPREMLIPHSGK